MALMYSNGMPIGTAMPHFDLPGVDGKNYTPESFADAKLLVVVFTCNHCPYAIASEDRLIAHQNDYRDKGVEFVLINPNDPERYQADSMVMMIARSEEKKFPFPYLQDESQEIARAFDAACTPDLFVFDAERKLRYNGRIDDNWQDPYHVTKHDLRIALDDLLAQRDISIEIVPSMGCSIKWK